MTAIGFGSCGGAAAVPPSSCAHKRDGCACRREQFERAIQTFTKRAILQDPNRSTKHYN